MTVLPPLAARWMILGEWRAHPARLVIGILAIAVGVALGFAVHLVNRTALASFDAAIASVNGAADLQIHAVTPAGFAESLYPRIARAPGVATASPVVELAARSAPLRAPGTSPATANGRLTLLGLDMLRAATVTPSLMALPPRAGPGNADPFPSGAVFVSRAALAATNHKIGDSIAITAAGVRQNFTIAGLLPAAAADQALAVIDIADAQWRFAQLGRLQRIDLKLEATINRDQAIRTITALLPPDAELISPASTAQRSDSLSRA